MSCDPLTAGRVNKDRVKGHQLIVIVHLLHKRGRRKLKRWRNIKSLQRDKKLAEIKMLEENIVRSHGTHSAIVAVNQSLLLLHLSNASVIHLHHRLVVKEQVKMLWNLNTSLVQFPLRLRNRVLS